MFVSPTIRRPRRRLLPAAPVWLAVLFITLVQRAATVRESGDRGDNPTVSNTVWVVAALALGLTATGIIGAWAVSQLGVFGGG